MARNFVTDAIAYISCTDSTDLLQAALKLYVYVPYNFLPLHLGFYSKS